ncbi:MAG: glycosyltransferase [bacterium]|nr:glycosyltransferase [bacterium]
MNTIQLTYLVTTKNKLPFLKSRLDKLTQNRGVDEEILVADGASTDGSREFLKKAFEAGEIDYFTSEPDFGESHALNKLFLIAKGNLITIITDDDAFYYPAIQASKGFLLEHPDIDIISTDGGSFHKTSSSLDEHPLQLIRTLDYRQKYEEWTKNKTPFSFCGLGVMLRRSSLPLLGLWDLSFRAADAEFSLRTTAGKAKIAWYTGYSFVNISNPQSVSFVFKDKIKVEIKRLDQFYFGNKKKLILKQKFRTLMAGFRSFIIGKTRLSKEVFESRWLNLAEVAEKWLEIKNGEKLPEFLWNKK